MKRRNVHFERGPIGWVQRYALLAYDHPFALFFGIGIAIIFVGALGITLGFELSDTEYEWRIKTNRHVKQAAAIDEAFDSISEETLQQKYSVAPTELQTYITYRVKSGPRPFNVFTEENLITIREIENFVMGYQNYTDVCRRNYTEGGTLDTVHCDVPLSVLRNFFHYNVEEAQFEDWIDSDISDVQERINRGIERIRENRFINLFYLTEEFNATTHPISEYTRSRFELGLPIDFLRFRVNRGRNPSEVFQYNNSKTNEDDQIDEIYDEFLKDLEEDIFDLLDMNAPGVMRTEYSDIGERGNLEVILYNEELLEREIDRIVMFDFMWATLSIISVWFYMLFHLGSVFLSIVGIFEIFISFPVALFLYSPVFQIEFFSEINILVVFILLGIGADDIFVFTDAYKQSGSVPGCDKSLQSRLMYSAARASKAVFVTSFTTMAAFFATAATPLMPMQAFGIFAALCIILLFIINLFLMPPALVLYAGYTPILSRILCPCCCIPERRPGWMIKYCPCMTCCHVEVDKSFNLPLAEPVENAEAIQVSTHVVDNTNTTSVSTSAGTSAPKDEAIEVKNRPGEVEMTPGQSAGATTSAQEQNPVQNFSSDHPDGPPIEFKRQASLADAELENLRVLERFFHGPFFFFVERAKYVILVIALALFVIGIVYVSTFQTPDEAEEWLPSSHAFSRFQDYFDPNHTPFTDSPDDSVAEVHLAWGIEGMDTSNRNIWDGDDFGDIVYDETFDITPRDHQQFLLEVCPRVRAAECHAEGCTGGYLITLNREGISTEDYPEALYPQQKCWIEDFNEWLQETRNQSIPIDPNIFIDSLLEYLEDPAKSVEYGEQIGYSQNDQHLRFVMFRFESSFQPPASASRTKGVIDEWEDLINQLNADATSAGLEGVNKGFESGGDPWSWPSNSDALVSGALLGVILVFIIAFIVLNIATGNLIISTIAVVTIAGILSVVMGIGVRGIMDWDLGAAESITVVIVIGFSMDYTLHLSDAYMESPHSTRRERIRDALTHLGISVTAGGLTTLISGLFLWATILVFFQKFAFNITATVITSYLFSVLVFPSLCLIIGPQDNYGSWPRMINGCAKKLGLKQPCGTSETSQE
eukprot:g2502.t1